MALCTIDTLENLVRPEKQNEWEEAKKKWFVQDHNDARDLRKPGKMKLEWSTTNGALIA